MEKIIFRLKAAVEKRIRYNRTVSELSKLTDRELADLGIARSDIYRIATESVNKGVWA